MSDTESSGANGGFHGAVVSSGAQLTGGASLATGEARHAEVRRVEPGFTSQEFIEPTKLYTYFSKETNRFEVDTPIAVVSEIIAASLRGLRGAVREPDQVQRENQIALAWVNFYELANYLGRWQTFDEAFSMLATANEAHRSSPYTVPDLVALQKVLEMVRRNPVPTENEISIIFETLETNFDLNAPLSHVDFGDASEGL